MLLLVVTLLRFESSLPICIQFHCIVFFMNSKIMVFTILTVIHNTDMNDVKLHVVLHSVATVTVQHSIAILLLYNYFCLSPLN